MRIIHVEASTYCNARCPLCPRSLYGYKIDGVYPEVHLTVEKFKEALEKFPDRYFVYFNGNLGDPMMNPNILELTRLTECLTRVTTNGSIGNQQTWESLAHNKVEVSFSIDGLQDTNHLYRQDVDWDKVMQRVKWFIGAGGEATWKWIPFMHNKHQEQETRQLANKLGFIDFIVEDHGRNYGPVLDRDGKLTHWILPADESREPTPYDVKAGIERYKQTHANFMTENTVYEIDCEHERDESVYIDAQGRIAPCCYQGFDLPEVPFVELGNFKRLKETWSTTSCNPGCASNCSKRI